MATHGKWHPKGNTEEYRNHSNRLAVILHCNCFACILPLPSFAVTQLGKLICTMDSHLLLNTPFF